MKKTFIDLGITTVFDKDARTLTLSGYDKLGDLTIADFFLIVNMTKNTIVFNIGGETGYGGVYDGVNTITLEFDTTSMLNTDEFFGAINVKEDIKKIVDLGIMSDELGLPLVGNEGENARIISTGTYRYWKTDKRVDSQIEFDKGEALTLMTQYLSSIAPALQNVDTTGVLKVTASGTVVISSGTITNQVNVGGQPAQLMLTHLADINFNAVLSNILL